ncbi:hypothetical protein LV83_02026 [Algoriphagus yeomjeoni]|uniref:Uncharacterized protein n=1 Tax=Algoriphagus yeomjeoni TaxID=291403 RepID=A0A327PEB4_9BACT|nr:hypothetical protein LV83_02026 [Algoriphagus yeomjeoni]
MSDCKTGRFHNKLPKLKLIPKNFTINGGIVECSKALFLRHDHKVLISRVNGIS